MNTLFDVDGFSYNVSKDFIKSLVVFYSETLKATEDANNNLMVSRAFLSRALLVLLGHCLYLLLHTF